MRKKIIEELNRRQEKSKKGKNVKKMPKGKTKKTGEKKLVAFKLDSIEKSKRKRLQNLAKQAEIKANQSTELLKEKLKEYYKQHEKKIIEELNRRQEKSKKGKRGISQREVDGLVERVHYNEEKEDE